MIGIVWKLDTAVREAPGVIPSRQAVSNVVALARGKIHRRVGSPPESPGIHINPGVLVRTARSMKDTAIKEDEILKRIQHLTVIYERDLLGVDRQQASADRVFEYLGIESGPVTAKLEKIASTDMFEYIDNADEVKEALVDAGFEGYFDAAPGTSQTGSPRPTESWTPGGGG